MDWKQVQSVEELKILGKLKEVASCISSDLGGEVVPKNSWDKLWAYIADKRSPQAEVTAVPSQKQNTLLDVTCLQDLKKYGSFKEVKAQLEALLHLPKIVAKGWAELYAVIEKQPKAKEEPVVVASYESLYFKDEVCEIIFYLLGLEGEVRLKKLGITNRHYKDKEQANEWKMQLIKKIHPDQSKHPMAEEATKELNKLYGSMIKFAK